jgi:hypothetical protein
MFIKCCKSCPLNDSDWHFLKAKEKLERELDIEHFIKNIRLLRNAFKFLTTRRERYLVRMQADKNVIMFREEDKQHLANGSLV